ncbi:hypothetical protein NEOLEDRAFT_1131928 [Neolentinus lepideus HHB14362 ss-1]|uniref:Uncharacterized protein n=1 Tax=Neolentinus lepideus HHB14362 ss-1 TaxID=1314782 RepID=A0A165TBQ5_9AGAM|nr:hypothetical protein NEOLEDRAFT_1131928 [Neolentinus lepideus HHB14362 ss-1]
MAQPSSSHREREREHRSSRHSRRTISSSTLLLVLSLVLAVLAVMLSLPANREGGAPGDPQSSQGILNYLTPKRTQMLAQRERDVAVREAEVARREAELLAGAPGGVTPSPLVCPACPSIITQTEILPPVQTVIKEVIKEEGLTPPGWLREAQIRAEDVLDREIKLAERERDLSRREEAVNRREHDASRREAWIMEQLIGMNGESGPTVEEEYIYEPAGPGPKRNPPKVSPAPPVPPVPPRRSL